MPRQHRPSSAERLGDEQDISFDPGDHLWNPFAALEIGADEWTILAHFSGITAHHGEIGPNGGGELDLIDHQQIGAGDPWSPLARNFITSRHIDDVDRHINQLRTEGSGRIVTTALHKQ